MKAEKILKTQGVNITLIPTPREISSDCGMAIQLQCKDLARVKTILNNASLVIEGIYET